MNQTRKQPLKNLLVLNLDASGSMSQLREGVVKLFNSQVEFLVKRSKELEQETRAFVYKFDTNVKNLVWDTDVLRIPDIENLYYPSNSTALIDSILQSIADLKKIPQLYCDFSVLHYTISDGENNVNDWRASELRKELKNLPENWTFAFLAPDGFAASQARSYGFENIEMWDALSNKGIEEASRKITQATDGYMVGRSKGIRGTKSNLFSIDTSALKANVIKKSLEELKVGKDYTIIPVRGDQPIREYVEAFTKKPYRIGSAYYMLTKKESIQHHKQICIQHKVNGKVFGGVNARHLLGLPDHEVKVGPDTHGSAYEIFIQSSSVNRKLIDNTKLLLMK
jgi:hypothetical protein